MTVLIFAEKEIERKGEEEVLQVHLQEALHPHQATERKSNYFETQENKKT